MVRRDEAAVDVYDAQDGVVTGRGREQAGRLTKGLFCCLNNGCPLYIASRSRCRFHWNSIPDYCLEPHFTLSSLLFNAASLKCTA